MADDKLQLPEGYEDAQPVKASTSTEGVQLPEGYEDAQPVAKAPHGSGGGWEKPSLWEKSNEALLPAGRAEKEGKEYAEAPATLAESEHPAWTGMKKFGAGMYSDTAGTARQMLTSPLGIAMLGTGELGELLPKASTAAKALGVAHKAAGLGFGAQGAEEAYKGGSEMLDKGVNAENLSKTAQGVGQAILGGAGTLGGTEVGEQPATRALAAPVRGVAKMGKPLSHIIPSVGGIVAASELGIPHPFIVGGTVGRFILPPEALERMFATGRTLGLSAEEANIEHLQDRYDNAKHDAKEPQKAYEAHEASRQQGIPAPEEVLKAHEKAQVALQEAEAHLKAAQKDYADKMASKGVPVEQPLELSPEQQAAQAERSAPTPTKEQNDTKLKGLMEKIAPTEKPEATPQNVKLPGQVQPETFPQEPTAAPVAEETTNMRLLAGNQGVIAGRPPRLLTEGAPEASPEATPEAPKQPLGEILPPEKPAKPGRLGTLKVAEGGKVVDAEEPLQQKIEEGLQGTAKPFAVPPEHAELHEALSKYEAQLPTEEQKPIEEALAKHEEKLKATEEPVKAEELKAEEIKPATELNDENRRQIEHRIGKANADELLTSPEGIDTARRLIRGTNKQYADMANYLGMKGGTGEEGAWKPEDFKRSRAAHGGDLSPVKEQVINEMRKQMPDHTTLQEATKHWGPDVESYGTVAGGAPDVAGTKEGAEKDTEFFRQAREANPKGSFSDWVRQLKT